MHVVTKWDLQSQSLFARNAYNPEFCECITFATSSPAPASFTGDRAAFIGRNRSLRDPAAMEHERLSGGAGAGLDPCAALQIVVEIDPGQKAEMTFLLGQADDEEQARALVQRFRDPANVEAAFQETRRWWDRLLSTIEVETPELSTNLLLNRWLLYQTLSCRVWGRSAFYQSGGAYGFRDQLQDVMALVHAAPEIAREHILRAAARQFVEGDVQHWWHPESGGGVRTRISDDLLWLPFVTAHYVRTTGDAAILDRDRSVSRSQAAREAANTKASPFPPFPPRSGPLLEHCRRAIARASTAGPHGLPLIGGGDWNDGLNRVGSAAKARASGSRGFEICVLNDFAELLALRELATTKRRPAAPAPRSWHRRSTPRLGTERGIAADTLMMAPRWDPRNAPKPASIRSRNPGRRSPAPAIADRVDVALRSLEENLVREADDMILLFTPPFDKTAADVGYIKGYPPGVRENGGQYTHAATWVALAFARQGDGDKAVRLLRMLNPVEHARDEKDCERYKVEPYVMPGDVYSLAGHVGRGGWTWYTGRGGWIYRVWLEEVLGFQRRGDTLHDRPGHPERLAGLSSAISFPEHHLSHHGRESRPLFPRCHPGGIGWSRGSRQNRDVA